MAIRSLAQTYNRMTSMHRTVTATSYASLSQLKRRLDIMYQYRNNTRKDTDSRSDATPNKVENVCSGHLYQSFAAYEQAYGRSNNLSIGDFNGALDKMTSCTCNARQIAGCDCVSRHMGNYCTCNVRNPIECMCRSRTGGKYPSTCACDTRYTGCQCVSRSQTVSCNCNARCTCNVVNEFSNTAPYAQNYCSCKSRTLGNYCTCHARTMPSFQLSGLYGSRESYAGGVVHGAASSSNYHPAADNITLTLSGVQNCDCQARTIVDSQQNHANSNWDSYCGSGHMTSTTVGVCKCNTRTTPQTSLYDYCNCVSRTSSTHCSYHVVNP